MALLKVAVLGGRGRGDGTKNVGSLTSTTMEDTMNVKLISALTGICIYTIPGFLLIIHALHNQDMQGLIAAMGFWGVGWLSVISKK